MAANFDDFSVLRPRESASGLQLSPQPNLFEYTDPRAEQATLARVKPVLAELDIPILGIRDIVTSMRLEIDGVTFDCHRLCDTAMQDSWDWRPVPVSVYQRYRQAQEFGVTFAYWYWGEELFAVPQFRVNEQLREKKPNFFAGLFQKFTLWMADQLHDPCLIGVIAVAPNRGIFCLLGKWYV